MKALCSERFTDWSTKFEPFGLKCKEVTGDSELDDYYELQNVHIIMTTPVSLMFNNDIVYGAWLVLQFRWLVNRNGLQQLCFRNITITLHTILVAKIRAFS